MKNWILQSKRFCATHVASVDIDHNDCGIRFVNRNMYNATFFRDPAYPSKMRLCKVTY